MDKTNAKYVNRTKGAIIRNTDIVVHFFLVVVLLLTGIFGWIDWSLIRSTLIGMLLAAVGGIAIGMIANRYLGNSHNNGEILIGMTVTVGLGVLTIGYLYIVYIKGPMESIGTLNRTVQQTLIFIEFLIAHISGIRLGKRYLS